MTRPKPRSISWSLGYREAIRDAVRAMGRAQVDEKIVAIVKALTPAQHMKETP